MIGISASRFTPPDDPTTVSCPLWCQNPLKWEVDQLTCLEEFNKVSLREMTPHFHIFEFQFALVSSNGDRDVSQLAALRSSKRCLDLLDAGYWFKRLFSSHIDRQNRSRLFSRVVNSNPTPCMVCRYKRAKNSTAIPNASCEAFYDAANLQTQFVKPFTMFIEYYTHAN